MNLVQDWVGQRKTSVGWQLWWNWEVDRDHYPGWEQLVGDLKASGVRTMTYCNPFIVSVSVAFFTLQMPSPKFEEC
jgi:alpha-glucosidase (family GH31 glycosyl hydrolase)